MKAYGFGLSVAKQNKCSEVEIIGGGFLFNTLTTLRIRKKETKFKKDLSPGWFRSVGGMSALELKGRGLDSGRGHVPPLQAPFLALVGVPVGGKQLMSLSHIVSVPRTLSSPSPSHPSLSPSHPSLFLPL